MKLMYFAWIQEQIGTTEESIDITTPLNLENLIGFLRGKSQSHERVFSGRQKYYVALNGELQQNDDSSIMIHPHDVLAFFPPVSGG